MWDDFGLTQWANTTPRKIAVTDWRRAMSYGELADRAMAMAAYLEQQGIHPRDRVLVCLPNCCEMVTICFSAAILGFTVVLGNIQEKQRELQHVVDMAGPKLVILSSAAQREMLKEISPDLEVIKLNLEEKADALDFVPEGRVKNAYNASEDDPLIIICTSGSTGLPKGVLLSRESLYVSSIDVAERFHMTRDDVSYVSVPLCHMFGISGMLISVITGGRMVLTRKFFADKALELMEREKVTVQYAVATIYAREIECYEKCVEKPALSHLRTGMISGAPGAKAYMSWFEDNLGCRLLNAYGMTEAPSLAMADFEDPPHIRYNSSGYPCRHSQLAIIHDDGSVAREGEPGEIACKGLTIMLGYYGRPEETRKAFTKDGWFMTGDMGIRNSDGTFSIVGRKKDLIIRGGYNVVPTELESMFCESGYVRESCAVGFPHKDLGEGIAVFVALKDGVVMRPEQLLDYAKQNISKYKLPDRIILMSELPKLSNHKINKQELKKMLT